MADLLADTKLEDIRLLRREKVRGVADGTPACDHSKTPGGRDAGQHHGDLLGQDRYADRESDDRTGNCGRRQTIRDELDVPRPSVLKPGDEYSW